MKQSLVLVLLFFSGYISTAQSVENIILVTVDGLRWQEVYGGAVDSLLESEMTHKYAREGLKEKFYAKDKEEARQKLMPFFWSRLAEEGQLYGNRWKGSKMNCSNRFWFSYPGYNEILSGYSDPRIKSNDKINNPNVTILEWFNNMDEYKGRVAAFASWDVFPYIINEERSQIPVNAGFRKAREEGRTEMEEMLNYMQDQVTGPWYNVRLDAFTHNYAIEYLKKSKPKICYISYGETDDFAHDGRYDHYLIAAHKTDAWIADLWEYVESDPFYAGKTAMIITTDHGRGTSPMSEWKSHGTIYEGSNQIWAAAIGPQIRALGEAEGGPQLLQNQIAATVARLLGYEYKGGEYEAGRPIATIVDYVGKE